MLWLAQSAIARCPDAAARNVFMRIVILSGYRTDWESQQAELATTTLRLGHTYLIEAPLQIALFKEPLEFKINCLSELGASGSEPEDSRALDDCLIRASAMMVQNDLAERMTNLARWQWWRS